MPPLLHKIAVIYGKENKLELNAFMSSLHHCNYHQFQPVLAGSNVRGQRFKAVCILADVDTASTANNNWFAAFTQLNITKGDM